VTVGAGAGWTVAGKVYALENRLTVQETSSAFMARQVDWMVNTMWQGRPTTSPPMKEEVIAETTTVQSLSPDSQV
jgi:hypothetical protein